MALSPELKIDKKLLILILHNIACCYQKLKDYENCVSYLEAVIFHYDGLLESKHGIKVEFQCNFSLNKVDFFKVNNSEKNVNLGDIILQMRFSAKFHLQMCAVLSQANCHKEALDHARLSALICEDNLSKTFHLFNQMKHTLFENKQDEEGESQINEETFESTCLKKKDLSAFEEKLTEMSNIIENLYSKINHSNAVNNHLLKNNFLEVANGKNSDSTLHYSTKILKNEEIEKFIKNEKLKISVRNILGVKKKDDWINYLNIGNIMYLSALNYEDLDLDSDPKFELLRDAVLEKIIMLTVAYFCIATEFRFLDLELQSNKHTRRTNLTDKGEYWHSKSVEFACTYLPNSCPLVKHYISSYHKYYTNNLHTIPEDEIINNQVEIIRANVETDQDPVLFIRSIPRERNGFDLAENKTNFHINLNVLNTATPLNSSKPKIRKGKITPVGSLNFPKKPALSDRSTKVNFSKVDGNNNISKKMKIPLTNTHRQSSNSKSKYNHNTDIILTNLNFKKAKIKPTLNKTPAYKPYKPPIGLSIIKNPPNNIKSFKNLNFNKKQIPTGCTNTLNVNGKDILFAKFSNYLTKSSIPNNKIKNNRYPPLCIDSSPSSACLTETQKKTNKKLNN